MNHAVESNLVSYFSAEWSKEYFREHQNAYLTMNHPVDWSTALKIFLPESLSDTKLSGLIHKIDTLGIVNPVSEPSSRPDVTLT
jgi:hypothetical protein